MDNIFITVNIIIKDALYEYMNCSDKTFEEARKNKLQQIKNQNDEFNIDDIKFVELNHCYDCLLKRAKKYGELNDR